MLSFPTGSRSRYYDRATNFGQRNVQIQHGTAVTLRKYPQNTLVYLSLRLYAIQLLQAVPKWLKVENNLVPAVYEQVWQAVKLGPTFQYCDTKIITHLFTTSGLPLEKLGYLWSLTNVLSPGFLTRQELYIMLALIALVQVIISSYFRLSCNIL